MCPHRKVAGIVHRQLLLIKSTFSAEVSKLSPFSADPIEGARCIGTAPVVSAVLHRHLSRENSWISHKSEWTVMTRISFQSGLFFAS
jgi:hypothetical protein